MAKNDNNIGYTQTGNRWLTSLGNKVSLIPFIGGAVGSVMIMIDTTIEAAGWLLRGKPMSAAAVAGTGYVGAVSAAANTNPIWWAANVGSSLMTGRTINTHMRKGAEGLTSLVTKPVGLQPTVLRSYPAGIGGISGGMSQPGRFAAAESARRGQDAQQMHNAYLSGNTDHVAALQAAAQNQQLGR